MSSRIGFNSSGTSPTTTINPGPGDGSKMRDILNAATQYIDPLKWHGLEIDELEGVEEEDDDELELLDKPFQKSLTGKESRGDLEDRVIARDLQRETTRKKELAHAQRVIQVQYLKLGLSKEFLDGWFWRYLVFLYIRKTTNNSRISIITSHSYVREQPFDDQEHMTTIWIEMKQSILKFVDRPGADGKVIPIHNWINCVFKVVSEREWERKRKWDYLHSQIENDLSKRTGGQMSIDYAMRNAHPDFDLDESERDHRKNRGKRLTYDARDFIRLWPVREGKYPSTTEIIVTQTILQLNTLSAAEITRHMSVGGYPMLPPWVPESLPLPQTSVRTIQRMVRKLKDDLLLSFRKRGIHIPKPNPRGFKLKPPLTADQDMSINGSDRSKGMDPHRWIKMVSGGGE